MKMSRAASRSCPSKEGAYLPSPPLPSPPPAPLLVKVSGNHLGPCTLRVILGGANLCQNCRTYQNSADQRSYSFHFWSFCKCSNSGKVQKLYPIKITVGVMDTCGGEWMGTCIYMAEPLFYSPETITALLIGCILIHSFFGVRGN